MTSGAGFESADVLVARWPSHRLPQLVQRQRPDRGHGRRRRQSQGPRNAPADRQGLLRADRPAWSPDGRRGLRSPATCRDGPHTILPSPADGSAPPLDGFGLAMSGMFPTFSPDGPQIAFAGQRSRRHPGLYVADIGPAARLPAASTRAGSVPQAPTLFGGNQPQWSPDGRRSRSTPERRRPRRATSSSSRPTGRANASWHPTRRSTRTGRPTASASRSSAWWTRRNDLHGRPCTMRVWVINADGSGERRARPAGRRLRLRAASGRPTGPGCASLLIVDDSFHVGVLDASTATTRRSSSDRRTARPGSRSRGPAAGPVVRPLVGSLTDSPPGTDDPAHAGVAGFPPRAVRAYTGAFDTTANDGRRGR